VRNWAPSFPTSRSPSPFLPCLTPLLRYVYSSHALCYASHLRLPAPSPCTGSHLPPWSKAALAPSPGPELPPGQCQGSGHFLRGQPGPAVPWGGLRGDRRRGHEGCHAPGGKLLSWQQPLRVTVTPHRTVVRPSVCPSIHLSLSPITCFRCPSLRPKSITSVPLPRVLPPAPAAARHHPALRGVTAPHQHLPVPSLSDRLLEVSGVSPGAAAPQQLPLPQQVPGAGSSP